MTGLVKTGLSLSEAVNCPHMGMRNMKPRILIGLAFTGIASVANAHIMPEQASPNPISVTVHFNQSADFSFRTTASRYRLPAIVSLVARLTA
jgi:hypothetical protein